MNNLQAAMLDVARQYSMLETDKEVIGLYGAWEGMKVPPGTRVKVIVVLEHIPDPLVTIDIQPEPLEGTKKGERNGTK